MIILKHGNTYRIKQSPIKEMQNILCICTDNFIILLESRNYPRCHAGDSHSLDIMNPKHWEFQGTNLEFKEWYGMK